MYLFNEVTTTGTFIFHWIDDYNKSKTRLFCISFLFQFIYKNHDETDCVSEQFRKKKRI